MNYYYYSCDDDDKCMVLLLYISVHNTHVQCPQRPKEASNSLDTGGKSDYELLCGCWELNQVFWRIQCSLPLSHYSRCCYSFLKVFCLCGGAAWLPFSYAWHFFNFNHQFSDRSFKVYYYFTFAKVKNEA